MTGRPFTLSALVCAGLACSAPTMAQTPPPEPRIWTVSAGAGLALTSGNTDTSTVNASYEVIYDPQTGTRRQVRRTPDSGEDRRRALG